MYQFVNDTLYRRRPNGVKLKCICREEGEELLPHWIKGISWESILARILLAHNPPRCG